MNKVMVFGTFDTVHKGHESFFKQAKRLGDHLIVVVARDRYVKAAKGKLPRNNEELRIKNVRNAKIANKVILGSKTHNFYQTLRTYKIDIIALGYDQKPTISNLKKTLKRHRLAGVRIVRLRPYKQHIYKTKLLIK